MPRSMGLPGQKDSFMATIRKNAADTCDREGGGAPRHVEKLRMQDILFWRWVITLTLLFHSRIFRVGWLSLCTLTIMKMCRVDYTTALKEAERAEYLTDIHADDVSRASSYCRCRCILAIYAKTDICGQAQSTQCSPSAREDGPFW